MFFFFNDTATTEIYTLSLHDALPISCAETAKSSAATDARIALRFIRYFTCWPLDGHKWKLPRVRAGSWTIVGRSEEHTSELQSQSNLVCRLLLEKKRQSREVAIAYRV